jgi:hypothetical protein
METSMPKKKDGLPTAGQNSGLTDEERRALTLHHKRAYETADALVEAAKADHGEEGKTAGMAGDKCEPPSSLAHDASQKWIAGWHDGQTILMSAFKKKRPVDAPAGEGDQKAAA